MVEVFEDPDVRKGRRLQIHVVVLAATSDAPQRDPVFVLQGGPGQAASEQRGFYGGDSWAATRAERDIVLIDQRGTGKSNPLDCGDLASNGRSSPSYGGEIFPRRAIRACREKLERHANLTLYATPFAASDLETVRAALGYEQVNLYGTSYGTRLALVYARLFPHRVRSLVLKGVVAPDLVIPMPFAVDAQRALDFLLTDCAADSTCSKAFPALRRDIERLFERLSRRAVEVIVAGTPQDPAVTVSLNGGAVAHVVRGILQSTLSAARLPGVLHLAAAGDYRPLAQMVVDYRRGAAALYEGMFLSVTCTEDVPRIDRARAAKEAQGTFLGTYWVDQLLRACNEWPRGRLPEGYERWAPLQVPALMISGGLDPATPPRWGAAAAPLLPDARHIVIQNASHSFAGMVGCVDLLIAEFLAKGRAQNLNWGCISTIRRPPFVTGER